MNTNDLSKHRQLLQYLRGILVMYMDSNIVEKATVVIYSSIRLYEIDCKEIKTDNW
jgi:hypothetical protein